RDRAHDAEVPHTCSWCLTLKSHSRRRTPRRRPRQLSRDRRAGKGCEVGVHSVRQTPAARGPDSLYRRVTAEPLPPRPNPIEIARVSFRASFRLALVVALAACRAPAVALGTPSGSDQLLESL